MWITLSNKDVETNWISGSPKFLYRVYIVYIYDCIGKIVVLTRATVFGLEKRDLKPVRGGKSLMGNDGLGNPSQGQRIWQHLTWLITQAAIPTWAKPYHTKPRRGGAGQANANYFFVPAKRKHYEAGTAFGFDFGYSPMPNFSCLRPTWGHDLRPSHSSLSAPWKGRRLNSNSSWNTNTNRSQLAN